MVKRGNGETLAGGGDKRKHCTTMVAAALYVLDVVKVLDDVTLSVCDLLQKLRVLVSIFVCIGCGCIECAGGVARLRSLLDALSVAGETVVSVAVPLAPEFRALVILFRSLYEGLYLML